LSEAVLDSSAVLALLLAEPGAEVVAGTLPGALLSAVSFAEVVARLVSRGMPVAEIRAAVESVGIEIVAFDADQAGLCGDLGRQIADLGLTLSARACLALARLRSLPVITADPDWRIIAGIEVRVIRGGDSLPPPAVADTRPSWLRGL
jgi:PIN domain nuclease of toxin-antitoxin system